MQAPQQATNGKHLELRMDRTLERTVSTATILVGCFFHESNGFNPIVTYENAFEIENSDDVLVSGRESQSTLGGIVRTLEARKANIIPVQSAISPPSGRVDHAFFLETVSVWLSAIDAFKPDAIVLELHGAMATTETNDADGEFLSHLRSALGPSIVIAVGLDLHATITPAMLEAADICVACKENPHSDVVECGEDVAKLALEMLRGDLQPVLTIAKTRMLLPGKNETASQPLLDMHRKAKQIVAADEKIRDISLYNAFRFIDAEDIGQAVVVLTNGMTNHAVEIATDFANTFWIKRRQFHDDLLPIEQALHHIAEKKNQAGLPYAVADMGDRVLAGAPGDSTTILSAMLDGDIKLKAAIPVTDPAAVQLAKSAGRGSKVTLPIGGSMTPGFEPLPIHGVISSISNGRFLMKGPYKAGIEASMGESAVVTVNEQIHVLLTTKPAFSHDPNVFESQGLKISDLDFVVVKSGYHFELNFDGVAIPLHVASPGLAFYTPGGMPRKLGRVWPDHDVDSNWFIEPRTFDHRRTI